MSRFRHETEVTVRYSDLDPMGHVNNAVYATYLEQARSGYFKDVLGVRLDAVDTVIVHLEVDFHAALGSESDVTVAVRIPSLGGASIPMEYEVRDWNGGGGSDGNKGEDGAANEDDTAATGGDEGEDFAVAATGETVQLAYDRQAGTSRELPTAWREAIKYHEGL